MNKKQMLKDKLKSETIYANSVEAKRIKFLKTIQLCLTIPPLDSKALL